ncbi:MAG: hypothetical protein KGZ49_06145 [Syntrophaceae bacterium]|nr:hypothetical protein [Syntrophaceae bacterium]
MEEPKRVSPDEVHKKVKEGKALLVCAYEDEEKFKKVRLEGAISHGEFKLRDPSITKNQEIIFYCA